jgi:t-SNARE complex subunit (syntaxin)
MQNIDKISQSENSKKGIVIHFDYNEKEIENEIEKYSDKTNLKYADTSNEKECDIQSNECSEKDIEKIEKDVIELVEVFNTVHDMVVQQKDGINIIENNIDNTSEYIIIAQDDLDEIEKIKKDMSNKKRIMYSIGVIMISIPIGVLAGPFMGVTFAALGVGGLKGYSIYNKNNVDDK